MRGEAMMKREEKEIEKENTASLRFDRSATRDRERERGGEETRRVEQYMKASHPTVHPCPLPA